MWLYPIELFCSLYLCLSFCLSVFSHLVPSLDINILFLFHPTSPIFFWVGNSVLLSFVVPFVCIVNVSRTGCLTSIHAWTLFLCNTVLSVSQSRLLSLSSLVCSGSILCNSLLILPASSEMFTIRVHVILYVLIGCPCTENLVVVTGLPVQCSTLLCFPFFMNSPTSCYWWSESHLYPPPHPLSVVSCLMSTLHVFHVWASLM